MLAIINISQTPEVIQYEGETLIERIKSHVEDICSSYASYVRSIGEDVIFGATNPVKFLAMVQDWNESIRRDAITNVKTWLNHNAKLDDQFTYLAKIRLTEADDMFTPFGYHCVISENEMGFEYLHTVLAQDQLQDMNNNPQNYIIANITFDI